MEPPVKSPFLLRLTVAQEDIDEQGHVSNVRIVHFMNEAARAHSDALGYDYPRYREIGGSFVVRRHEIDYLAPAFAGDELLAYTWPCALARLTAERRHEIRRPRDGVVIARGWNQWVFVDVQSGRPKKMPLEIRETFDPALFL